MPRRPFPEERVQINLRLGRELMDLVDRLVEKRRAERAGSGVSRSDVIREAVYTIARAELGVAPPAKAPGRTRG